LKVDESTEISKGAVSLISSNREPCVGTEVRILIISGEERVQVAVAQVKEEIPEI